MIDESIQTNREHIKVANSNKEEQQKKRGINSLGACVCQLMSPSHQVPPTLKPALLPSFLLVDFFQVPFPAIAETPYSNFLWHTQHVWRSCFLQPALFLPSPHHEKNPSMAIWHPSKPVKGNRKRLLLLGWPTTASNAPRGTPCYFLLWFFVNLYLFNQFCVNRVEEKKKIFSLSALRSPTHAIQDLHFWHKIWGFLDGSKQTIWAKRQSLNWKYLIMKWILFCLCLQENKCIPLFKKIKLQQKTKRLWANSMANSQ